MGEIYFALKEIKNPMNGPKPKSMSTFQDFPSFALSLKPTGSL